MCGFTAAGGAAQRLTAEQKEIVDKHNEYRRSVKPPASNMLEMVTSKDNHLQSVTCLGALFSAEVLLTLGLFFLMLRHRNGTASLQPRLRNGPAIAASCPPTAPPAAEGSAVSSL